MRQGRWRRQRRRRTWFLKFHFIEFPDVALMRRILAVHHPHLDAKLLDQVLIKFYWLREQNELRKKPSTSEWSG